MRNRLMIGTAALLLASATLAGAQDKPQQTTTSSSGTVEPRRALHGRRRRRGPLRALPRPAERRRTPTSSTARRRRAGRSTSWRRTSATTTAATCSTSSSSKWKITALFDQTPTNYAYYTRTPYNCTAGDCSLDAGLRSQVQDEDGHRHPDHRGPGAGGGDLLQRDRQPVRPAVAARHDRRRGALLGHRQPRPHRRRQHLQARRATCRGAPSFAFPVGIELPLEIDNRATDWLGAVEWASHQGMARFEYQHQKFDQSIPSLALGQPAAGDRLLPVRHRRPAPGHVLGPERLHERQRAGLRPHGPAARRTPWTASTGWA